MSRIAVLGMFLLATGIVWGPDFSVGVELSRQQPDFLAASKHVNSSSESATETVNTPTTNIATTQIAEKSVPWLKPHHLLVGVWATISMVLLVRFVTGIWLCRRIIERSKSASAVLNAQCQDVAHALGMHNGVEVHLSGEVSGPVLVGYVRPCLLIPYGFLENARAVDAPGVFAHEMAHLRSNDLWWNSAMQLLLVFFWWHPLLWLIARIHKMSCEKACDAVAVAYTGDKEAYQRTLARAAVEMYWNKPLTFGLPIARRSEIGKRVDALEHRGEAGKANLRSVLVFCTALVAVLLLLSGLNLNRRGPGGSYEKAWASRNLKLKIGDNVFRVDAVARWASNGLVNLEDGEGNVLEAGNVQLSEPGNASSWLDMAEVHFSVAPGSFEIFETRIFDHATKKILNYPNRKYATGYDAKDGMVRLRSSGVPLPDTVDVWFRGASLPKNDPVWKMPAQVGASTVVDRFVLSLREVQPNYFGYSMKHNGQGPAQIEWMQSKTGQNNSSDAAFLFDWEFGEEGKVEQNLYWIHAVSKDGEKLFINGAPHFLNPGFGSSSVLSFCIDPEEIDHFEIHPFREFESRTAFYFDGVELPRMRPRVFAEPPVAIFTVNGKEGVYTSDALAPCRLEIEVERGVTWSGIEGTSYSYTYINADKPYADRDTMTTLKYNSKDIDFQDWTFKLFDRNRKSLNAHFARSGYVGNHSSYSAGALTVQVPLEEIGQVKLVFSSEAQGN